MKYHPDKNPDDPDAQAKFHDINDAYEVMSHDQHMPTRWLSRDRFSVMTIKEIFIIVMVKKDLKIKHNIMVTTSLGKKVITHLI